MSAHKNIWIYAELSNNLPNPVVYELIAKAKEMAAHNKEKVVAVVLGYGVKKCAEELVYHGADQVIVVSAPALASYNPGSYAAAMAQLVAKHCPSILLFGATAQGRCLAPRLQAKLLTGLTADCLDLSIDTDGLLLQTKPSYGDNIMCTITCPTARPQMASVRPKVFTPLSRNPLAHGEILEEQVDLLPDESYQLLKRKPIAQTDDDIALADKVVAIGRGAASERTATAAAKLAKSLGAALAVTRPLSDSGQFDQQMVIGQSGRTISPKYIINFGIAGAIQYVVGMQNANTIISVNSQEDAPIFNVSHYKVVADADEAINALLQVLASRQ